MAQLLNTALAQGQYDNVMVDASTDLIVELSALRVTKEADKAIWVKDELTYTIVVTNIDEQLPGLPVTGLTLRDTIDPTIAALINGSVTINGVLAVAGTDYTYNAATGELVVTLADLAPGGSHTITFQVSLVPQP